jgi:hypothetical protein
MSSPRPTIAPDSSGTRDRKRLPLSRKVMFALVPLVASFGFAELLCRGREAMASSGYSPLEPDASCGVVLVPGARYERDGRVASINALGMRSPDVGPRRAGVQRILCVGASSTYGLFVQDNASTWPSQLEQRLRARGRAVEVLNAGGIRLPGPSR